MYRADFSLSLPMSGASTPATPQPLTMRPGTAPPGGWASPVPMSLAARPGTAHPPAASQRPGPGADEKERRQTSSLAESGGNPPDTKANQIRDYSAEPGAHLGVKVLVLSAQKRYATSQGFRRGFRSYYAPRRGATRAELYHRQYVDARGGVSELPRRVKNSLLTAETLLFKSRPVGLHATVGHIDVALADQSVFTFQFGQQRAQTKRRSLLFGRPPGVPPPGVLSGEFQSIMVTGAPTRGRTALHIGPVSCAYLGTRVYVAAMDTVGEHGQALAMWNPARDPNAADRASVAFLPKGLVRTAVIAPTNRTEAAPEAPAAGRSNAHLNANAFQPRKQAHTIRANGVQSLFLYVYYHRLVVVSFNPRAGPTKENKDGSADLWVHASLDFPRSCRLVDAVFREGASAPAANDERTAGSAATSTAASALVAGSSVILCYEDARTPNVQRIVIQQAVYRDSRLTLLDADPHGSNKLVWTFRVAGLARPKVTAVSHSATGDRVCVGLDSGVIILVELSGDEGSVNEPGRERKSARSGGDAVVMRELKRVNTGNRHPCVLKWHPSGAFVVAIFNNGDVTVYDWALQTLRVLSDAGTGTDSLNLGIDSPAVLAAWKPVEARPLGDAQGGKDPVQAAHARTWTRFEPLELAVVHAHGPVYLLRFLRGARLHAALTPAHILEQRLAFWEVSEAHQSLRFLSRNADLARCLAQFVARVTFEGSTASDVDVHECMDILLCLLKEFWPRFASPNAEYHRTVAKMFHELVDEACRLGRFLDAHHIAHTIANPAEIEDYRERVRADPRAPDVLLRLAMGDTVGPGRRTKKKLPAPPLGGDVLRTMLQGLEMEMKGNIVGAAQLYGRDDAAHNARLQLLASRLEQRITKDSTDEDNAVARRGLESPSMHDRQLFDAAGKENVRMTLKLAGNDAFLRASRRVQAELAAERAGTAGDRKH